MEDVDGVLELIWRKDLVLFERCDVMSRCGMECDGGDIKDGSFRKRSLSD